VSFKGKASSLISNMREKKKERAANIANSMSSNAVKEVSPEFDYVEKRDRVEVPNLATAEEETESKFADGPAEKNNQLSLWENTKGPACAGSRKDSVQGLSRNSLVMYQARSHVAASIELPQIGSQGISSWGFDVLDMSAEQCEAYVYHLFDQFGLIDEFELDKNVVIDFVGAILGKYREVDYHDYLHATQVVHQTGWLLLRTQSANDYIVLGLLLAALCHDVDHPGNNNGFEIQADTELARIYAYDSVLERHHCATALRVLHNDKLNVLKTLGRDDSFKVKSVLVHAILSTDMNEHSVLMGRLEELTPEVFDDIEEQSHNTQLTKCLIAAIIHTADLSTNAMDLGVAKRWGNKCLEEFKCQGEKEKEKGLVVTSFMENLVEDKDRCKIQFGFVKFVCKPWFLTMSKFEMFELDEPLANLNAVIGYYDEGQ